MSEKRFEYDPSINHFTDTETNKEYCEYNLDKVVDLLNEQDNEIKQLKKEKENFELIIKDRIRFLKQEDIRILGGAEVRELEWVLAVLSERMHVNYDKIRNWKYE